MKRRVPTLTAGLAIAALLLVGCSAPAPEITEEPEMDIGTEANPVTIDLWHPNPFMPDIVAVFEASHPTIKVNLTSVPNSAPDIAAKLIAAVQAGEGPDVLRAEYQMLPYLVSQGAVDQLEYFSIEDGMFRDSLKQLVNFGGAYYGAPDDFTPMMFFYRADLFDELKLKVPKTWAEYEALARQVKEVAPEKFLGNYNYDSNTFAGWSAQAGADWWKADGETWSVGIDSAETLKAAQFQADLISEGLISTEVGAGVNNLLGDGTLLSWTTGAWAPNTIMNSNPANDGLWRAAPMPVWEKGDTETGVAGGSALILGKDTDERAAAETFIEWMTDTEEGILTRLTYTTNLPGSSRMDESEELLAISPKPIASSQDYLTLVASQTPRVFSNWGPNTLLMQSTWLDLAPQAMAGDITMKQALAKLQKVIVDDMERSGFTIED